MTDSGPRSKRLVKALTVGPRTGREARTPRTLTEALAMQAKRSKYRAVRCEVDGEKFDSKREARRWCELRMLEKVGAIRELRRQVRYPLLAFSDTGQPVEVGAFVADFDYLTRPDWHRTTEDSKGFRTPMYHWKKKHFQAQYGRTILET